VVAKTYKEQKLLRKCRRMAGISTSPMEESLKKSTGFKAAMLG
jgi:hypothetical protein